MFRSLRGAGRFVFIAVTSLGVLLTLAIAPRATAQNQVGSFVSGERPIYLEISPLVEGQNLHVEMRNLPAKPKGPLLIVSFDVNPINLAPFGVPGFLGPD